MRPNPSLPHTRVCIALAMSALLRTSATAEPSRSGVTQRPPTNLKLDQVDSVTGTKRTLAPGKIEPPNARAKGGDAVKWELSEFDAAKAPRAKTASTTGKTYGADAPKSGSNFFEAWPAKSVDRRKGGDPFKAEVIGIEPDMAKAPRAKTAKAASGDEAGTLKGMRTNPAPGSPNAASASRAVGSSGTSPNQKFAVQFNPKELQVDKRK